MNKRWLTASLLVVLVSGVSATVARADSAFPQFPQDNPYAAFINSNAYAQEKGATAEWRKMEGVALDKANKRIYYAITAIAKGMSDGKGDIQLKENPCGVVLMGQLDDDYNVTSLAPVVVGGPYDKNNKDYPCSADAISNPDNVFVDGNGNLWIGEDTDLHKNQVLWMWNGKDLKRFATLPEGAESTGLRIESDGTLFSNVQHPKGTNKFPFNRAVVGTVAGYKAGDDFKSLPVPKGDDTKRMTVAAGTYQVLARAGEPMPGVTTPTMFGQVLAADGKLLNVCNSPDGNMFIGTSADGGEGYLYTNWECSPGGVSKIYIKRGPDGKWSATDGESVDFLPAKGTKDNCNASVTPWNTGLTSEEYPPDVEGEYGDWADALKKTEAYLGAKPNPYAVGYVSELQPGGGEDDGLGTQIAKHFAMGRQSWEMALVMPDGKTVYSGNDGTDRVMLKFVADAEGDLSAGTLYAAKVKQDGDKLNLEWIELGKGKDADIAKAVDELGATLKY